MAHLESERSARIVIVLGRLPDFSQSTVIAHKESWFTDFFKQALPGLLSFSLLTARGRLALFGWDPQEYLDTYGLARPHSGPECPTAKRQLSGGIHLRG